jgi:hypothetical protein
MTNSVYDAFGIAATYTDRNGASAPVVIVVDRALARYGNTMQVSANTAVVCVRTSELSGAPRRGETFLTEDGDTWTVDSLITADEFEHRSLAALS